MDTHAPPSSTAATLAAPLAGARLRILIVGGGIAGLTLAALLRQRGERPVVIERQPEDAGGYMLGLLPLGGRVLHGLGLHEDYLAESCPMRAYELHDRHGRLIRRYPLDPIVARFGAYRGIERGRLLRLLHRACEPGAVLHAATLSDLEEREDGVEVRFADGSAQVFDLVVGADGLGSDIRRRIGPAGEPAGRATGWAGRVVWAPPLVPGDDTYRELWGAGWGIGLYPVRDRLGIFLAGRQEDLAATTPADRIDWTRRKLPEGPFRAALDRAEPDGASFLWRMEDRRATRWATGRVVLLGDAAAGFLPTAGVGASMAMDSAAALADELSRAGAGRIGYALSLFERRQRRRVERAQAASRSLARWMFVNSRTGAFLRDRALRFYSLDMIARDLSRIMNGR